MTTTPFSLLLGTPRSGWLPITIVAGNQRFELVGSNVLNDPLHELAVAAVSLANDEVVNAVVSVWEEPGTFELRFTSESATAVTIEIRETSAWPGKATRLNATRFFGECDRGQVASAVIGVLRVLEARTPRTGLMEGWGKFPSTELRRVSPAPGAQRLFLPPWRAVHGLERANDELRAEVGPRHPLFNVPVSVAAWHTDDDEYLFELGSGPDAFAVVHLTWSGQRDKNPMWPATEFFASWDDWVDRRMLPDSTARAR